MGLIATPRAWTSQPPYQAGINGGNPITAGLAFLKNHSTRHTAFNGLYAFQVGGPPGIGSQLNNGANGPIYSTGATGVTGTDYTLLALATATSGATYQLAIDDDDGASLRVFQLRLDNAQKVELITFDTGGAPYFATQPSAVSARGLTNGFVMGATVKGNSIASWSEGKKTTGSASNTQKAPTGNFWIGDNKANAFPWGTGGLFMVAIWSRCLSDAEMVSLTANPWQLFAPEDDIIYVSSGAASHATSGALTAAAATLAGTAAHLTLHASTGVLAAGAATLAGTAAHPHTSSGVLAAGAATLSGTAAHQHASTGALVAGAATLAGTAARASAGAHATSGALAADAATLAGTAAHLTLHATTGALAAGLATLAATAAHLTLHASAGVLAAGLATLSGTAAGPSNGTGQSPAIRLLTYLL